MNPRTTAKKTYAHTEWKTRYDELSNALAQIDPNQAAQSKDTIIQLNQELTRLKLTEKHYEYVNCPDVLLASFIRDVQHECDSYDHEHLFTQSDVTRLVMLRIHTTINCIQDETQQLLDTAAAKKIHQDRYDQLCKELASYTSELLFHKKMTIADELMKVLNQYHIAIPMITHSALTKDDFDHLHETESTAYRNAIQQLRTTLTALPHTMHAVKDDGNALINKIEADRLASDNSNSFNYKRHTINLTKTNELIKNPTHVPLQNEYIELIQRNNDNTAVRRAMMAMVIGVVVAVVSLIIAFSGPSLLLGGLIIAGVGFGITGGSGIAIPAIKAVRQLTSTEGKMSRLFSDLKHAPQTPPPTATNAAATIAVTSAQQQTTKTTVTLRK